MTLRTRVLGILRAEPLVRIADRITLRVRPGRPAGEAAVLIAPPGRGNIGDQALVEAFVEAVRAPVIVVVRSTEDIGIPPHLADRMTLLPLPALIYGTAIGRARDARKLAVALRGAGSISVIGADIMDGAYVPRASVNRAALAERLAVLGWPVRVIGFSWNAAPLPAALSALARAQRAGVDLLVRDPLSAARARADGLAVTETADVVFLATSIDDSLVAELTGGEPYALVNASGLVGADDGILAQYDLILASLRARGLRVIVLPHVSRPGADDLPLCTAIAERAQLAAAEPAVTLVPRLLTPAQIRGLAAGATVTVTGRMHLAVMSLMAGTPAITLATQGKVEGLMRLFDAPELCVEPGPRLGEDVVARLGAVLSDAATRSALLEKLPAVDALAEANVAGLRPAREGAIRA